ncbi:GGDEF domain-containing protein [Actinomycetospora chibensis]|uniref:GGDEF domain-containing protein n=1 Tax=Actinomycetospora chibensis TaxID=663606 RepID=A0ABV9RNH4_9PSEU|nr:GGDEF domain-containing protein [Actinomycetospora chibensis]MDD7924915.1 GGDEF domain-containing protein [Actinomycetospora chibensis]
MDARTNTGGPAGSGPGRGAVDGAAPRPGRAAALRERWFACSCALGWGAAAEWPDPAVDAVCAVVTARHPGGTAARDRAVERALARWAGARAGAGVGLAETLTDLAALNTAVSGGGSDTPGRDDPTASALDVAPPGRGPDGVRLLRAVSVAWTDVACGDLAETAAVDPLSGLASVRYLRTRLAEIYRAARAHGHAAGEEHALVVLALDVRDWRRVAPLTIAGEAAGVVFDAGESIAVVGRGTVVVLAPRGGLAERAAVLRRLLGRRLAAAEGMVGTPSVRIARLPATHDGACALLERLRDEGPDEPGPDEPGPAEV